MIIFNYLIIVIIMIIYFNYLIDYDCLSYWYLIYLFIDWYFMINDYYHLISIILIIIYYLSHYYHFRLSSPIIFIHFSHYYHFIRLVIIYLNRCYHFFILSNFHQSILKINLYCFAIVSYWFYLCYSCRCYHHYLFILGCHCCLCCCGLCIIVSY